MEGLYRMKSMIMSRRIKSIKIIQLKRVQAVELLIQC